MKIELKIEKESLYKVRQLVRELGEKHRLSKEILSQIDLALGEILTNILSYSGLNESSPPILLSYDITKKDVQFVIKDQGMAFNPLEYSQKEQNLSLEERSIGGLGILLAIESMDSISYKRENEENQLLLIKFLNKNKGAQKNS